MAALPARRSGRNLTLVNPSREFEDIYERMGQLMNLAFGLVPADLGDMPWSPLADLSEPDNAYVVKVDLPGVNKDQVDIQLQDRELVISGEIADDQNGDAAIAARAAPAGSSSGPTCPVRSTPTRSPRSSPTGC